jgi:peroxiredoxin (alkyl hydroperoxide reductase subunit C)
MPEEFKAGCQSPPIKKPTLVTEEANLVTVKEEVKAMVKVGKPAPEFTAKGFFGGKFANYSLSEYKGKWVLVCFYPGDFTFV